MPESQTATPFPPVIQLTEAENAIVEMFVHVAQSFGFQKSIGQIYGVLFATAQPLCLDDITDRLGISKGSASQGLKTLRSLGAVQQALIPGDRRDHYTPEIRLRKLVSGLLTNQVDQALDNGADRLGHIHTLIQEGVADPEIKTRIAKLHNWHGKFQKLIPMIKTLVGNE
ncbi:MAG: hypothetical protein HRU10_10510 [Opitutales bacterium]|nr:hypothetical protein [Opitutales bacterium]